MRQEDVAFFSGGAKLAGTLLVPDVADGPVPGIVQGPGWLGLRDTKLYVPYHEAITAAGFAVLTLDYRGFGGSGGDATLLDPMGQVADIRAGLDYLQTRPEVDGDSLGVFGSGGTGGGNAVYAAGLDGRVRATVAQVPVADGRDWLRRMRREHEWVEYERQVHQARLDYALTGRPELVDPRDSIMVASPERSASGAKKDVDGRSAQLVALHAAASFMDYRPIDVVDRIAPRALMLIAVEHDGVTPEDHAVALYERAGSPKRLVMQTGATHYGAYAQYRDVVNPLIVEWYRRYLARGEVMVREDVAGDVSGIRWLSRPPAVTEASGV